MSVQQEIAHDNAMVAAIRALDMVREMPYAVEHRRAPKTVYEPVAAFANVDVAKRFAVCAADFGKPDDSFRTVLISTREVV